MHTAFVLQKMQHKEESQPQLSPCIPPRRNDSLIPVSQKTEIEPSSAVEGPMQGQLGKFKSSTELWEVPHLIFRELKKTRNTQLTLPPCCAHRMEVCVFPFLCSEQRHSFITVPSPLSLESFQQTLLLLIPNSLKLSSALVQDQGTRMHTRV